MNIAIIPARGGSKRIPHKNIKPFWGQPIIAYTIKTAIAAGCFERIVVTTDDDDIASVAREYGADVLMRPPELATDMAATMPVVAHALAQQPDIGQIENTCLMYATAPLMCANDICQALDILQEQHAEYVFAAIAYPSPIQRAFSVDDKHGVNMFQPEYLHTRSQDLIPAYHDAAQFYWGKSQAFLAQKPVFAPHSHAKIIDRWRVQDIDDMDDWDLAERLYSLTPDSIKTDAL